MSDDGWTEPARADRTWAGPDRTDQSWAGPSPADGGWDQWPEPPARRGGTGPIVLAVLVTALVTGLIGAVVYLLLERGGDGTPSATGSGAPAAAPAQQYPPEQQSAPGAGQQAAPAGDATGAAPPYQGVPADQGSTGSGTAPESGTYSGTLSQRGTSSTRQDRDYSVEMTFSSGGSTVRYPSLGCAGRLVPRGDSGDSRVYSETITSGRCDQGGTWTVTRSSSSTLDTQYEPPSGRYIVVGTLTR